MAKYTRAMEAVDNNQRFGSWEVLGHVPNDPRRVFAICHGCEQEFNVDIFDLRRGRDRCQSCANKIKFGTFQPLPGREALKNEALYRTKKETVKRGLAFELSNDFFFDIITQDCFYCGQAPARIVSTRKDSMLVNGIDRVDNSIGYVEDNCVPCCKDCNYMKRVMGQAEFITKCKEIANRHG